jgi:hypothetical protein
LSITSAAVAAGSNTSKMIDDHTKSIIAPVATSINNMTYLKQRTGQASAHKTMASYLKSLQTKREILGPNHLSVGKTLNNIGSVFYLQLNRDGDMARTAPIYGRHLFAIFLTFFGSYLGA